MKVVIDDEVCKKFELSFPEVLAILLVKTCNDIPKLFNELLNKEALVEVSASLLEKQKLMVTQRWDDLCSNVLLTSDSSVPTEDRIEPLAKALMEIFPKGKKEGTSTYWRGNLKDTKLRLKKFFKLYGNKFSNEEIISAAERYVKSFNGNYSYMRVLKYFIWKDARKIDAEGNGYVEEMSDLATLIENEDVTVNDDWTSELR